MHLTTVISSILLLIVPATAQFQFFEQMFGGNGGGGGGGGGGGPFQGRQQQNAASDSTWYQQQYENVHCDKYLCPQTLACVHFPHHCPCAFPSVEEKVEFQDGGMTCVSKGGWSEGEALRKVELARKGLL